MHRSAPNMPRRHPASQAQQILIDLSMHHPFKFRPGIDWLQDWLQGHCSLSSPSGHCSQSAMPNPLPNDTILTAAALTTPAITNFHSHQWRLQGSSCLLCLVNPADCGALWYLEVALAFLIMAYVISQHQSPHRIGSSSSLSYSTGAHASILSPAP